MTVTVEPAQGVVGYGRDIRRGRLAVYQDGRRVGTILDTGSNWLSRLDGPVAVEYRVIDAGPGVPLPNTGPYPTEEAAAAAIVDTRERHRTWLAPGPDGLTDFDRQALAFEATPDATMTDGTREAKIQALFRMHPSTYAAKLAKLLTEHREAALGADPAGAGKVLARMAARRRYKQRLTGRRAATS